MRKRIALALLVAFPAFEQRASAGEHANAHLLDQTLHAPVLVASGQLALVPSAQLLASAAAGDANEEGCTEECDPAYYDPLTGEECVLVCDEAQGGEAAIERAQDEEDQGDGEPQVVIAQQPPAQDNPITWVLVGVALAVGIAAAAYLVNVQCDPVSGTNCF